MADGRGDVTELLHELSSGKREAFHPLIELVYDELSQMARARLAYERKDHTLDTCALVHEAYFRLADQRRVAWQSRAHFYAVAAQAMRRILMNHAEKHRAAKRGGGMRPVPLDDAFGVALTGASEPINLLDLDDALSKLESFNERGCRVVECRFFAGMSMDEIAEALGVSTVTVRCSWTAARLWLRRELLDAGAF